MAVETSVEDLESQNDEMQALESIYSPNFTVVNLEDKTFEILITSGKPKLPTVTLRFTFGPGYPSSACPTFTS
nr:unnamed protein product [Spirometra erinaceieuropaei]